MNTTELFQLSELSLQKDERSEYLRAIVKKPEKFRYYNFLYLLAKEVKPKHIVELGTNQGASALHFKLGCPESCVTTVDIKIPPHVKKLLEENNIHYRVMDSVKGLYTIKPEIDILFIDALHTYSKVKAEYITALPKMKKGGIILLDDIEHNELKPLFAGIKEEKTKLNHLHPVSGFGAVIA